MPTQAVPPPGAGAACAHERLHRDLPVPGPPGAGVRAAPRRTAHGVSCQICYTNRRTVLPKVRKITTIRVCAPFVSPLLGVQCTAWAWGGNHGWRESAGLRVVVTADGAGNLTYENVRDHCRQWLPGYLVPGIIEFPEALPGTSTGKVDRGPRPGAA